MKMSTTFGLMAALAASLVIAGCYTQFESTHEDQPSDNVTYSEADTLGGGATPTEGYEDARYRFYVDIGYPYWSPGFAIGFWDPYPFDPWYWGPPAYWYPYGAYYYSGWYYPPAAYYPPGYWYGAPVVVYPDGQAGYTYRTFGSTRSYGAVRTGTGGYRSLPATLGVTAGATSGLRPSPMRPIRTATQPAVQGQKATGGTAVDRPMTPLPAVRPSGTDARSTAPKVRPAPAKGKTEDAKTPSATPQRAPQRKSSDGAVKPRSGNSGGSRSYSPPPSSYTPPSRSSGSESRGGHSGGAASAPRSGGGRR